jgi:ATP-binding cassette subfamily B (MDR/TAP) protein 1
MLERFYDPLIGRVTLDGVDIREINVASYRSEMALVSQEPTLYAGTVRFNILLGANKPMGQVTEEEVIQATKDANIVSPSRVESRARWHMPTLGIRGRR